MTLFQRAGAFLRHQAILCFVSPDSFKCHGSYGSHNAALLDRFKGSVGDRYSVECPRSCSMADRSIYGCGLGPYLDESSICKAAVGLKLIGDDTGGMVTFELVEPIDFYPACTLRGLNDLDNDKSGSVQIETNKWTWYKWRYPDRPQNINRFCEPAWIAANPGVACQKDIDHYRASCQNSAGHMHCFGIHAFRFIEPCAKPVLSPDTGIFEDSTDITVTPGEQDPTTFIVCTTDGSAPDASGKGKMPAIPPDGIITLAPGNYTIQCQAASSDRGPSRYTRALIDVLPRLPLPDIDPDTDTTFVEDVMVSIDPLEEGVVIYFTVDGTDPTAESEEYTEPFQISTIGTNTIKAMSQKIEWAQSHVTTSEIKLLERIANPTFEPYMGAFTNTLTAHIVSSTAGAKIYYTTDGSVPNSASREYVDGEGIVLGLDADGNEATYVIKAIATLEPSMGDSFLAISGQLVIQPPVAIPALSPATPGPFENSVQVTITCATIDAEIRYTTDGSPPTFTSTLYQAPFVLTKTNMVVQAKAFAPHMSPSEVAISEPFVLEASEVTFTPDGGVFVDNVQVALASATPGAAIHYTLDGTEPSNTSPIYIGSFSVGVTDLVVKAIAIHAHLQPSSVVDSAGFTVKASSPVLDPTQGAFTAEALIKVTSGTSGSEIRCTLDGSEPTADTPVVPSPVSVTQTGSVVRCVATRQGLTVSDITSMAAPVIIKAIPPVMTPDAGSFTNEASVVMSCATEGCTMRYTLDGTTPGPASTLYEGPVLVTTTGTVVQCISVADGKSSSDVAAAGPFAIYAAAPSFEANGTRWGQSNGEIEYYVEDAVISMQTDTENGVIVFSVDGKDPSATSGTEYSEPYQDTTYGKETLKAIVFAPGKLASPVSSSVIFDILVKTAVPTIKPNSGGPFTAMVEVTIASTNADAKIYMTTDGSTPTSTSSEYVQPFSITSVGTTVVKAFISVPGQADSEVVEQSFLVLEQVAPPTLAPASGVFSDTITVMASCATEGAQIRYTTDGSTPNAGSAQFDANEGIVLWTGQDGAQTSYVVKAIALLPPDMGDR